MRFIYLVGVYTPLLFVCSYGHSTVGIVVVVLLLSVGLPVANAPDVLQPCGLLYYP